MEIVEDTKYDSLGASYCSKKVVVPNSLGVWKIIRKGWEVFYKLVRYDVGDGSTVWFCHDLCCWEEPLNFFFQNYSLLLVVRCVGGKHSLEYILYKTHEWLRGGCAL
jgi:hypothetical protein